MLLFERIAVLSFKFFLKQIQNVLNTEGNLLYHTIVGINNRLKLNHKQYQ